MTALRRSISAARGETQLSGPPADNIEVWSLSEAPLALKDDVAAIST
jgi:hypothetical protein